MSKARVIVLSVVEQGMSKADAARKFGVSRRWVHTLVERYETGGLNALEPRSRKPHTSKAATSPEIRDRIIHHRQSLRTEGLDAGPVTIAWHLEQEGITAPAISTIRRIITTAGLVAPEPAKRPRSSYVRFQADQPNETWQSDFTHWALADGTDTEILNWLDDHSRMLLSCTVHTHVTGADVVESFTRNTETYGIPASTLTDNGLVYTTRFRGSRNAFEYLLAAMDVTQKNGHPYHPQTQGKIERFHQTLKRWLDARPAAETATELQPNSTSSGSSTTNSDPTEPSAGSPRNKPGTPRSKPPPTANRSASTTASGATSSTNSANSPSAGPAPSTTSESAATTPAKPSSSSPTPPKPPSPTNTPAKFSASTTSTQTETTGPTKPKSPADGRALCELSRDSYENDVSTHHNGGSKGIRTPDPLEQFGAPRRG
jgi:transposase InsO family protein